MKRSAAFLILFVFISSVAVRAEEVSLTLQEAINIALRDNRDVLLKTGDVIKAKAKIAEVNASLFPTLNFTGAWTDTRGLYSKDLGQSTAQLTLKQYLYKGGEAINTIEQNKYKAQVSTSLLDKTKLELILNVKKAFYTLLLAKEFASLNQGILENTREHLNFIKERYQYGQASASEILNIDASLNSVQQAYQASLNQVEATQALLNNLLYLDKDTRITPAAQFTYEPIELAYDEAFLKATGSRPEIKQYAAQAKADQEAIEIAKSDNRPNIFASWDYYSRSHLGATTGKNWNDYNVIGLTFTWPIFDGWATKAKVEQAIVDLKETELTKEKTIGDIALELKNAYLDLKDAISGIKSQEAQVELYKDTLSAIEEKYKAGLTSSLDLGDASLGYKVSLFNRSQATYDYAIAKAEFEKATGG
ncbi:MAG: TolC family protein [Candidatus Omnitrophica bacterium]|nr:TolC family protein [Candidatus Omnitrophota bacterium]